MIVVLVGASCTGKTLLEEHSNMPAIVSHTTRPKRVGEREGIDYFFTTEAAIFKLDAVERTSYIVDGKEWHYALASDQVKQGIVTINPRGLEQLINDGRFNDRLFIIYLHAPLSIRRKRYLARENDTEALLRWHQRRRQDIIDFNHMDKVLIPKIKDLNIPLKHLANINNNGGDKLWQRLKKILPKKYN